jgi:prepilin-type N-terminal cleavage/methylation domain-containing protein
MKRGFTLIEVVIVVGISVLLTSVVLSYSSTGRDQVYLSIEKAQVGQVIAKAKSLTISTYNQPDVPCGYGVWFDYPNKKYEIFRYKISPCSDVVTLGIIHGSGYSAEPQNKFSLPPNIAFGSGADQIDTVFFTPPDPKTYLWQESSPEISGKIYLKTVSGSATNWVSVSSAGQITF